jgi:hypothetical protein
VLWELGRREESWAMCDAWERVVTEHEEQKWQARAE